MPPADPNPAATPIPRRPLGRSGQSVTIFGLGGEGILRTHGRQSEAVAVIRRALQQGVNYFETAPAYASSMDYYGAGLGEHRPEIFLASKTHDRTYSGSLRQGHVRLHRTQRVPGRWHRKFRARNLFLPIPQWNFNSRSFQSFGWCYEGEKSPQNMPLPLVYPVDLW